MFSSPRRLLKAAHPYLSPLRLFTRYVETTTPTTPFTPGPGGPSDAIPTTIPYPSTQTPRRRYYRAADDTLFSYSKLSPTRHKPNRAGIHPPTPNATRTPHRVRDIRNLKKRGSLKAAKMKPFLESPKVTRELLVDARAGAAGLTWEDEVFLEQMMKLGVNHDFNTKLAEARVSVEEAEQIAPLLEETREERMAKRSPCREEGTTTEGPKAEETKAEEPKIETEEAERKFMDPLNPFLNPPATPKHTKRIVSSPGDHTPRFPFTHRPQGIQERKFLDTMRQCDESRKEAAQARIRMEAEARRAREEECRRKLAAALERERRVREKIEKRAREEAARVLAAQKEAARRQAAYEAELRARHQAQQEAYLAEQLRQQQAERLAQARYHAQQEAAFQAEQASARAQYHNQRQEELLNDLQCKFDDFMAQSMEDVHMRDASMYVDMDASMRTASAYIRSPSPTPPPPPPMPPTPAQRYAIYEQKWEALKSVTPVLGFSDLPWPVLEDVFSPDDVTNDLLRDFVFNPQRPSYESKNVKERAKAELLRWHPDKFDSKVIPKVHPDHREAVKETASRVARFLIRPEA